MNTMPQNLADAKTNKWFLFILIYLLIDYGRPQDLLHFGFLKPGLITILILIFFIYKFGFTNSKSNQSRMIWYFIILLSAYIPFATNNYWAYQTTVEMLGYLPFILSVIICVNSFERLKKIINFIIAILIYISLFSLAHKGMGSGGYFHDENDVSLFINMWIPFCFYLFMIEKEFKMKVFYASGLLLGVTAVVISFSRGGFVGLVAVAVFIWVFSERKMLYLTIIAVIGIVIYLYAGQAYINEMSTVTDENEGTAQARLLSWYSAWDMFVDNPLGVGGNNFQFRFPEYQGDRFQRGMGGRVAHSLWFTLIPELGVIGIFIYFKLMFYNYKDLLFLKKIDVGKDPELQYIKALSLAFVASLAGFFASGTFISVLYYPHYWYSTALIAATMKVYSSYKAKLESRIDV